jgi:DNA-binding transcriptional LysR family regulator
MELRDIEYFNVVAEHRHLGRAAEALGLSQPALSKSLRRLEHELGAKLVNRTPKGVELTAEGTALLGRARELHLSFQAVAEEIRDVGRGRVGHVRIGAGPVSSVEMLVKALVPLIDEAPRITYDIVVSDNDLMIPALRRGDLDLIVGYAPRALPRDGLAEELLFELDFAVIAAADHPLAARKVVTLVELSRERWALTGELAHAAALAPNVSRAWTSGARHCRRDPFAPAAAATRCIVAPARLHIDRRVSRCKEKFSAEEAARARTRVASARERRLSRGRVFVAGGAARHRVHQGGVIITRRTDIGRRALISNPSMR